MLEYESLDISLVIFSIILAMVLTIIIKTVIESWYTRLPSTKLIRNETQRLEAMVQKRNENRIWKEI